MSIQHRYSTRFQMAKAQQAEQVPQAQQAQQVPQAEQAQQVPQAQQAEQVPQAPQAQQAEQAQQASNKSVTHHYKTRLQCKLEKKHQDCKKIGALIDKAHNTSEITVSPERLYAVATIFEELYHTDVWKTHERFNAIIRMKIGEFRNTIHMIRTCYDETVGIVVSGRTILMGSHYVTAAYRALYAMETLEKRMNA